jgi:hypothetical protein
MAQDPSQPSLRGVRGWLDIYDYPKHSIRIKKKTYPIISKAIDTCIYKKNIKKGLDNKKVHDYAYSCLFLYFKNIYLKLILLCLFEINIVLVFLDHFNVLI